MKTYDSPTLTHLRTSDSSHWTLCGQQPQQLNSVETIQEDGHYASGPGGYCLRCVVGLPARAR